MASDKAYLERMLIRLSTQSHTNCHQGVRKQASCICMKTVCSLMHELSYRLFLPLHDQITTKFGPEIGFGTCSKFCFEHFLIRTAILDLQDLFKLAKLKKILIFKKSKNQKMAKIKRSKNQKMENQKIKNQNFRKSEIGK